MGHHAARAYWKEKFGGNNPPNCASQDAVTGVGDPGGACLRCPHNQWGSSTKGNRGKACKEMHRVFLLQEDGEALVPLIVSLPPTSIRPFSVYMTRLAMAGRPYWSVVSQLGLAGATNKDGLVYSKLDVKVVRELEDGLAKQVAALKEGLAGVLRNRPVGQQEYAAQDSDEPF